MSNNILKYTKHVAFLLILAGSFFSCEKEDYNPEKFRLVKILHYAKSTDSQPKDGVERSFDEAGNLARESFYKYSPTVDLYMYNEYEYSGSKKMKMNLFDKENDIFKLSRSIDFFYENDRLIKEEFKRNNGTLLTSTNYEYQGGNLIREYCYEPDYGIFDEVKYTYDSQNRLTLEEIETSDVKASKYTKYIYDNDGRKKKLEYYNLNWELIRSVEMIYNGRSKLPVKDVHYDKNGVQTLQYLHYYDKRGNLTETCLENGCSLFKRKYNGGLLIEEIHYFDPVIQKECLEKGMTRYEYQKL